MKQVTRKAYAKINLGLDVLNKRADGYHEVRMIMQTVGIYDELVFSEAEEGSFQVHVQGNSSGTEDLPTDENNLVIKAAKLTAQTCGLAKGLHVVLTKNIPIAAGLAGGSTDAAAAIRGMNQLYDLGMTAEQMQEIALRVGADVPYCLTGGTALAEGIGEKLTALPPAPACKLLVVKPDISVSTPHIYNSLDALSIQWHPDIDGLIRCITYQDAAAMAERIGNVLETVTEQEYPIIRELKEEMTELGAAGALMSGSGPTVFGIFQTEEQLQKAYESLKGRAGIEQLFMTGLIADVDA